MLRKFVFDIANDRIVFLFYAFLEIAKLANYNVKVLFHFEIYGRDINAFLQFAKFGKLFQENMCTFIAEMARDV